jgi:SNF2 family DNA or RNA helicase
MGVSPSNIRVVDLPQKNRIRGTLKYIAAHKRLKSMKEGYIIINWDSVASLGKELRQAGPWWHIIADEVHRIKGRKTARTINFLKLRAKQRTGLSGTPADNKPEDFWQVLNWLLPSMFSSYWRFVDETCETFVTKSGYKKITGVNREGIAALHEKIAPYYDRVRMKDVVADMPERVYETWWVDMGAKQRKEYDELVKDDIASIKGGDIIASLPIVKVVRQQQMAIGCCTGVWTTKQLPNGECEPWFDISITDTPPSPKLDLIMEWLTDEDNADEALVVGAQHPDTIEMLRVRCERSGIKSAVVTGSCSPRDRSERIGSFQRGSCRVFMGTIASIREGIDLSRARTIIRIDKPWNPNWNKQFESRCDSMLDPRATQIIDIVARNSIDEYRLDRIQRKADDTELMLG